MINKIYSMIGLCMKAGKLAYGSDMCEEKIKFSKVSLLIVSKDASENTKEKFREICNRNNIAFIVFGTKDELSHSIGKDNKAVVAVLDNGFGIKIKDMVKEVKGANN